MGEYSSFAVLVKNCAPFGAVAYIRYPKGYRFYATPYKIINPTKLAIREAQEGFAGLVDELGLKTEEDVFELCREVRKEMWVKANADNG